jgi:thymidylate synthase
MFGIAHKAMVYIMNMASYHNEEGYLALLKDTITSGEYRKTRNGHVYSRFACMITFDTFPLLTTKKMFTRGIIEELLWFLRGSTDAKELQAKGVHIWDGNSSREYLDSIGLSHYAEGELGPVYGWQWRHFGKAYKQDNTNGFDQIKYVIEELMKTDNSRRAVLTAWNPAQLSEMALPPCHMVYTFYKDSSGLSCLMHMRSSDLFLGLPFNLCSTAVLTHIIGKILNIPVNKISIAITDAHVYEEHIDAVNTQLKNKICSSPTLSIKKEIPVASTIEEKLAWICNLTYEDFEIKEYMSAPAIKAPMK